MKTAEQIARDAFGGQPEPGEMIPARDAIRLAMIAVEADREQRDLYELVAEALDERADWDGTEGEQAKSAAAAIRAEFDDDIWDRFIGPMLDRIAREIGVRP